MALTQTVEQLVQLVTIQQRYQRGAWDEVIRLSRAYARLKTNGTALQPDGSSVAFCHSEVEQRIKNAQEDIMQAIMQAYAEDAKTVQSSPNNGHTPIIEIVELNDEDIVELIS